MVTLEGIVNWNNQPDREAVSQEGKISVPEKNP